MYLHDRVLRTARHLAWELGAVADPDLLSAFTLVRLLDLFRGDCVGLNAISARTGDAHALMEPDPMTPALTDALNSHIHDHPMVQHYLNPATSLLPVRVSDIVDNQGWHHTAIYADVFRPLGTDRQLAIMVKTGSPSGIIGYAVNRRGSDFTSEDVELATVLQPVLMTLYRAAHHRWADENAAQRNGFQISMTTREVEVLNLLAEGATAQAIGHRLSISHGTVRKHLENIYRKLNSSDRLSAVNRARELRFITPHGPSEFSGELSD